MSPDELRAHADRIADRYNIQDCDAALWRAMVHVVQAARNLADVIEYAEEVGIVRRATVLDIARGDTTNHENRSET